MTNEQHPFREWIQLEQPRLGTRVTFASDEFFGAKERLIKPEPPVFIKDKYDDHGKWMDGWETRRKRGSGHDQCIVRMGVRAIVRGVDIDTRFFTGNFPPCASLDATVSDVDVPTGQWTEILPKKDLCGDAHHFFPLDGDAEWTHVRLNIFPDGGVARFRLFGEVPPDPHTLNGIIDLFALENGGRAIACSDEHFGSMHNLNLPGRGINMGDGWETARRRVPGNDWAIVALGCPGRIVRTEIDTAHFKGNFPERVSLEAALFHMGKPVRADSKRWQVLLPESSLQMDKRHCFADELVDLGRVSHVRMSIYPDGGVSRLRLFGEALR